MLVTPDIVYLQLQKTGCSHIERLLQRFAPTVESHGKHYRPAPGFDPGDRLVTSSIRNPWEWYLSYWSYSSMRKGGPYQRSTARRSALRVLFDERLNNASGVRVRRMRQLPRAVRAERARPAALWRTLYADPSPKTFRRWLKTTLRYERRFDLFQDYGHSTLSEFAGLLTYLYMFLNARDALPLFDGRIGNYQELAEFDQAQNMAEAFIRVEQLEDDFVSVMDQAGTPLSEGEADAVYAMGKTNASHRAARMTDYYDDETADLVRQRDRLIIEKYGYAFPGGE